MELPDLGFRPTIGAALTRAAAEFGDVDYVVTNTDRITYAQAERRSALLARRLLAHGVGKGTRVGLFYPNGTDWVLWWLAASRIGALVVPFSTLYAPGELAKGLRLGTHLLIAPSRAVSVDFAVFLEDALPDSPRTPVRRSRCARPLPAADLDHRRHRQTVGPRGGFHRFGRRCCATRDSVGCRSEVCPADPAVMIHTSGSTADPKGDPLPRRAHAPVGVPVRHDERLRPTRPAHPLPVGDAVLLDRRNPARHGLAAQPADHPHPRPYRTRRRA